MSRVGVEIYPEMISTSGYYSPEAVRARLEKARARAKQLEALSCSVATQKDKRAREAAQRRALRIRQVLTLRTKGWDWTAIGKKLGITRQGARYIYDTRNGTNPTRNPGPSHGPSTATPAADPSAKSSSRSQSA